MRRPVSTADPLPNLLRAALATRDLGGRRACALAVAAGTLILATLAWAAHAHTPLSRHAITVRLTHALPARRPAAGRPTQRPHYSARAHAKIKNAPTGWTALVGDRTPLSSDPALAEQSASWTPASPWLAAQNMSALFPACNGRAPRNCDALVAHETTRAVQAALWTSQNPPDCSKGRYLVLEQAWQSGLGSAVHVHAGMLALAIR